MHNTPKPRGPKVDWFKRYRVCVAMENSNAVDYVSEKLWDAFAAGCVPIYLGAPNAEQDYLPSGRSVIQAGGVSVGELAAEIKRVLEDKAAFQEYTAWRRAPFEELSEGYLHLLGMKNYSSFPFFQCRLCQLLAERKAQRLQRQLR